MTDDRILQSYRNFQIIDSMMNISTVSSRAPLVDKSCKVSNVCSRKETGQSAYKGESDRRCLVGRVVDDVNNCDDDDDGEEDWLVNRWRHDDDYDKEEVHVEYTLPDNRTSTPHRHRALSAWDRDFAALDRDLSQNDRNRFVWEQDEKRHGCDSKIASWQNKRDKVIGINASSNKLRSSSDKNVKSQYKDPDTIDQQYPQDLQGDPAWDRDDQVNWDGERQYRSSPLHLTSALPNVRLEYGTR